MGRLRIEVDRWWTLGARHHELWFSSADSTARGVLDSYAGDLTAFMLQVSPMSSEAFEQAMPHEIVDLKVGSRSRGRHIHLALLQIDGHADNPERSWARRIVRRLRPLAKLRFRNPFFVLLLAKMSANDVPMTARKPKSASAQTACSLRGSAAEILPGQQNARLLVARIGPAQKALHPSRTFSSRKRNSPNPRALNALRNCLGMI